MRGKKGMKKTKTQINEEILLEKFLSNEYLTVVQIMDLIKCNRQSVYNYIKRLQNNGYSFKKETRSNNVYYFLIKDDMFDDENLYQPMTLDVLRKYTIVQELQGGAIEKEKLRKKFTVYKSKEENVSGTKIPLDVGISKYYQMIKELQKNGDIELNIQTDSYYLTGKNIPCQLMIDYDGLFDLHDKLLCVSKGSPYYEQLKKIYFKTDILLGIFDESMPYYDNYIIYGKKMNGLNAVAKGLEKISKCDYRNKVLKISSMSQNNDRKISVFATGKVVYNVEKDILYLIGKEYQSKKDNDKFHYKIIKVSNIYDVEETDRVNDCYNDIYFKRQLDYMFSISVEKPVYVKVEFDRVAKVQRKVESLAKNRKYADIEVLEGKIVYTDKISGLSDFIMYLRRFGKSVHVVEPESLKRKLQYSVNNTLKRYGEDVQNG